MEERFDGIVEIVMWASGEEAMEDEIKRRNAS